MRLRASIAVRAALVTALVAMVGAAVPASANANEQPNLTVMTRNLYLGADLTPATQAQDLTQFVLAATTIWNKVQLTSFPVRAGAVADEIQQTQPDVIGLEEVSNWIGVGQGAPAGYDFLALLQSQLAQRGLSYDVASVSNNANIGPVPIWCGTGLCSWGIILQDRDVILVRSGDPALTWGNARSGNYRVQQTFQPPVPNAQPVSFNRGWATVKIRFHGESAKIALTHLETEDAPAVQEAQARQFLNGPAQGSGPVIGLGDFNSAADNSTTRSYRMLTRWFKDAWKVTRPGDLGYSCCQDELLTNPTSALHSRIDLVLTHGDVRPLSSQLVGDTPFEATPPLWASDHAGVVATVRLH